LPEWRSSAVFQTARPREIPDHPASTGLQALLSPNTPTKLGDVKRFAETASQKAQAAKP